MHCFSSIFISNAYTIKYLYLQGMEIQVNEWIKAHYICFVDNCKIILHHYDTQCSTDVHQQRDKNRCFSNAAFFPQKVQKLLFIHYQEIETRKKYLIEINMFHRFILRMKHLFFKPITHDYIFHQILSICKHDKLMSTIFCCVLRFLSLMIQNRSSHRNMNIST